ncbi:MAG: hypothetical protein LRY55_01500 [Leadbetterella sp.]|nr:hypothetical protein [Leadbetterella sp.]
MKVRQIAARKNIALVAHDHKKDDIIQWALENRHILKNHDLLATGTTGKLLEEHLELPVKAAQRAFGGATSRSGRSLRRVK